MSYIAKSPPNLFWGCLGIRDDEPEISKRLSRLRITPPPLRVAPLGRAAEGLSVKRGGFFWHNLKVKDKLGGGNSNFFDVHPYLGKIPILTSIFFKWVGSTTSILLMVG